TLDVLFDSEKKHKRKAALLNKLPGHNKPISPVVPSPAEKRDRVFLELLVTVLQNFSDTHARVFHQKQTRYSVFFCSEEIDLADLLGGEYLHSHGLRAITLC